MEVMGSVLGQGCVFIPTSIILLCAKVCIFIYCEVCCLHVNWNVYAHECTLGHQVYVFVKIPIGVSEIQKETWKRHLN